MGLDNRDPRPGEIARVGGHRRQPVLNPAMHNTDAGHIEPHGMRRCLDFLIIFDVAFFNVKIEARAKNIVNTVKKWGPGRVSSSKNCHVFN